MWEKTLNLLLLSIAFYEAWIWPSNWESLTSPFPVIGMCMYLHVYICVCASMARSQCQGSSLRDALCLIFETRSPTNLNLELPDLADQWVVGIWWQSTTSPWEFPSQGAVLATFVLGIRTNQALCLDSSWPFTSSWATAEVLLQEASSVLWLWLSLCLPVDQATLRTLWDLVTSISE